MNFYRVITVVIFCYVTSAGETIAQFDPAQWPSKNLRFSGQGTLTDIFDSGLRPYRFPGLERTLLEIKHVRVTIVRRNAEMLPEFPAELIEVTPLQGGLLSSMELTRYKTTLDEARALMLPYLSKEGRSVQELDRYLAAVKADYLDYDGMGRGVEDFRVRWSDAGGPRYVAAFRKAFDATRPLIMFISIDWSQVRTPREGRSFYKEPIPPPPGYENVSMKAPLKFGPDSQADILLSQGKPIAGDRPPPDAVAASAPNLPSATPTPTVPPPLPANAVAQAPVVASERSAPLWPWVVGGILALIAIIAVVLKRRA